MEKFIKKFSETRITDISEVGGKNASIGEMFSCLTDKGIQIPNGFSITVSAFHYFIAYNLLSEKLQKVINSLDRKEFSNLAKIGMEARRLIMESIMPGDLQMAMIYAYDDLFENDIQPVAVRSSATAEDLPNASFAGQHDSYLNINGHDALIYTVRKCFASLYTDRAIKYREDMGFDHSKVFLSVGVQKMVRSDIGCSGVGFTLEPESGFKDIVHLAGVWGLGENIVQGKVNPDEFLVFKPSLNRKFRSIIQKNLGSKSKTLVYAGINDTINTTINKDTSWELRGKFILTDQEIEQIATWAILIEEHYGKPMDFEWAKDGVNQQLYIIQARPETVHSLQKKLLVKTCIISEKGKELTRGEAIGSMITCGTARLISSLQEADKLREGDILVTDTTSPDWDPILKKVGGIVTNKGGRTSHAAIVARELGTVAVVGTENATSQIKDGDEITISCAEGKVGYIYQGKLTWKETITDVSQIKLPETVKAQVIIADPAKAFQLSFFPNDGVGLLRIEFIINNFVRVHPMALVNFNQVTDEVDRIKIENLTHTYKKKEQYFVNKLAEGTATIAAAFYPKEVIVRMSDFKSNEYASLIGGKYFEPMENNPMIGFRGASRYDHDRYREGFKLECDAMKIVRNEMGLTNIKLMIPFCRTVAEGTKVTDLMASYGLKRGENGLEILVMAEIPSNVLLAEEFAEIFDGFSIGSNDLTQLTLGIDRDSALIADLFDEQNEASEQLIMMMIQKANKLNRPVGLCGQAPSDSEAFTRFLVTSGINSISFNPDALIKGIKNINQALSGVKGISA